MITLRVCWNPIMFGNSIETVGKLFASKLEMGFPKMKALKQNTPEL